MSPPYKRMILINESEYFQLAKSKKKLPATLPIDQVQKIHAHNLEEERKELAAAEEPLPPKQLPVSLVRLSIDKFPLYARARAHAILQQLLSDQVSWDEEGQVRLADGELIVNSNIIDLIYYAAADKSRGKQPPPIGFNKLNVRPRITAMRRIVAPENVPLPPSPVKRIAKRQPPAEQIKRRGIVIGENYLAV